MKKKSRPAQKKPEPPKRRTLAEIEADRHNRQIASLNHTFEAAIGSVTQAIKANRSHYASQVNIAETAMSKKMKRK